MLPDGTGTGGFVALMVADPDADTLEPDIPSLLKTFKLLMLQYALVKAVGLFCTYS